MLADPTGKKWYDMIQAGGKQGVDAAVEIIVAFSQNTFPPALASLPAPRPTAQPGRWRSKPPEKHNDLRPVQRLHRVRVDVKRWRDEPSPRRDLPRRR